MRYLLDTHTLLWWMTTPEVLPQSLRDILDDRSNVLLLSVAVPWELAIKTNTGSWMRIKSFVILNPGN